MTTLQEGVHDELIQIAAPEDLAAFLRASKIDLAKSGPDKKEQRH